MGQVCFDYNDAIGERLRQALLEEVFAPAAITAMTNPEKTTNARRVVVGWVREVYRQWRMREEADTDGDIT